MKRTHAKTLLTAAVVLASLGTAAPSQAAVIVSEDFNYANGKIDGLSGGTGFSGGWSNTNIVNISNGVAVMTQWGQAWSTRTLATPIADTGELWVSFDWGYTSGPSGSHWGGLTFFDNTGGDGDGGERLIIGDTYGSGTWGINGAGFAPTQTSESSIGTMKTGVARITMGAGATDSIELWVGAAGSPVDVSGPAMASASGMNLQGVETLRILGDGHVQSMDNIVIGTEMSDVAAVVPEPGSLALLGLGGLLLARRRRV